MVPTISRPATLSAPQVDGMAVQHQRIDADVADVEAVAQVAEDEADGQRHGDGERAGQHHLLQRGAGDDADAAAVVGLGGALHDAGVLAELVAHVFDDELRGAAHRLDGQRREEDR